MSYCFPIFLQKSYKQKSFFYTDDPWTIQGLGAVAPGQKKHFLYNSGKWWYHIFVSLEILTWPIRTLSLSGMLFQIVTLIKARVVSFISPYLLCQNDLELKNLDYVFQVSRCLGWKIKTLRLMVIFSSSRGINLN